MENFMAANSVIRAYFRIKLLSRDVHQTLRDYGLAINSFECFQDEIRLLHRGIFCVLTSINIPVAESVALGLRTTERSWHEPPPDAQTAIAEVERIIQYMEPLINMRYGILHVPNYDPLFSIAFESAINNIQVFYDNHPLSSSNSSNMSPQANPHVALPGATEEQINSIPVHIATDENASQICSICVSNFIAGEQIKILSCSHRFHKDCIDTWLKQSATCPMDRSRAFPNSVC